MFVFVLLAFLYLIGVVTSYLLAQYFDWEDYPLDGNMGPPPSVFALFWFIGLPIMLLWRAGSKVKDLGKQNRKRKEQKIRIRIAEEEKANRLQAEAEREAESYYQELQNNRVNR